NTSATGQSRPRNQAPARPRSPPKSGPNTTNASSNIPCRARNVFPWRPSSAMPSPRSSTPSPHHHRREHTDPLGRREHAPPHQRDRDYTEKTTPPKLGPLKKQGGCAVREIIPTASPRTNPKRGTGMAAINELLAQI